MRTVHPGDALRRAVRSLLRRSVVVASILALVALVIGSAGAAARTAAKNTTTKGVPSGVTLSIGDQSKYLETFLRASGQLDNLPYDVEFKAFLSGPLLVQGFNAGQVDVGILGDTPAAGAAGAHIPVKTLAVTQSDGATISLVARPGIKSIAQLEGKKVAFTTGTAQHAFALRALKKGGLRGKDVEQVDVALQQLGTVLDAGQADASVLQVADKIRYLSEHPDAKELANNTNVEPATYGYLLATSDALADKGKAAALFDLVKRLIKANAWKDAHPDAWVQAYYVDVAHQDPKFAAQLNRAAGISYVPVTDDVQTALQQMVDLEAAEKAIPSSFSVKPLFDAKTTAAYNAIVEKSGS
jgi:sulfonate transport system substrate-binding protein